MRGPRHKAGCGARNTAKQRGLSPPGDAPASALQALELTLRLRPHLVAAVRCWSIFIDWPTKLGVCKSTAVGGGGWGGAGGGCKCGRGGLTISMECGATAQLPLAGALQDQAVPSSRPHASSRERAALWEWQRRRLTLGAQGHDVEAHVLALREVEHRHVAVQEACRRGAGARV